MSSPPCASCGAALPSGAAFCDMCGRPVLGNAAPARQRILTPQAGIAMRRARERGEHLMRTLGPEKITALVGGFFGLVGALAPFYRVDAQAFIGPIDLVRINMPTPSLAHAGALGAVVILAALLLGIAPLVTIPSRALNLAGFGLSAGVLGMVLGDFLRSSMFGRTFADGFYFTFIGFALLCYVYARRAYT